MFGSEILLKALVRDGHRVLGLSVGYENRVFRCEGFADVLMEGLPDFALNFEESENLRHANAYSKLRKAATIVYESEKYKSRGEFGELILHVILRDWYGTVPAISKIYYKTSSNDTVKGFDAVHIVEVGKDLEVWLGEAKFYGSVTDAINEVEKELEAHMDFNFFKNECIFISNHISDRWPHAQTLKDLLDEKRSKDDVFARLRIPVLVTYDSKVIGAHNQETPEFIDAFCKEVKHYHDHFRTKKLPPHEIVFILIPLEEKLKLATAIHNRIKGLKPVPTPPAPPTPPAEVKP